MAKKIILINPPRYDLVPITTMRDIPYGLLKIGGHLLEQGHEVKLINCMANNLDLRSTEKIKCGNYENEHIEREVVYRGMYLDELETRLKEIKSPDEIWVTSSMTYYWRGVHEAVKIAKKIHPESTVLLGGIYASLCPDHAKLSGADIIHKGPYLPAENSRTALELLERIPPYFIIKYTRGCPHNCSYCAVSKLEGHKMEFMETERFVSELEEKYERFGVTKFHLWESNLLVNARNRFEKVLDQIIEKKLPIFLSFPEGLQPSLVYPELAWKMRKAGVREFALPLESAEKELYDRFHKPSTLIQFDNAVKMFKNAGFKPKQIRIFVLVGMPDQTIESIIKSDFKVLAMNCHLSNLLFTPIPGTEEYEKYRLFLENKSLEELHPAAVPMANEKMTVKDITDVADLNSNTALYDLVPIKECHIKELFKEEIKKHIVDEKEFGPDNDKDIQILHLEQTKELKTEELVKKLREIRNSGKFYAFYKPIPKCKLNIGNKNLGTKYSIPSSCDKCLKMFTEGCKLNQQSVKIKQQCRNCIYFKRKKCFMACEQIETLK